MKKLYWIFLIPILFFIISLARINNYGINWDEPIHFNRGQAYLHLFTSGNIHYLPNDKGGIKATAFESPDYDAAYYLAHDSGHPPLNGILAALSNKIFYQWLGIVGDIESYHLFTIFTSFLLVLAVSVFAFQAFGLFAGIVAGLSIATYPLLVAESQFNIKDPPQAAFYTIAVWLLWWSLQKFNWKLLLLSALSFVVSLSMKFNILFAPLIVGPYLFIHFYSLKKLHLPKPFVITALISPLLVMVLFIGLWPYLWSDPLHNFLSIFGYYHDIGTATVFDGKYLWHGYNTFPLLWIIYTTPPLVLLLTVMAAIFTIWQKQKISKVLVLWWLWLLIPIIRVTLPGTSIYGGDRQIIEFLPAMCLLAGFAASQLHHIFNKSAWLVLLLFIPHVMILQSLHPNENVYFNQLIGGLKGAQQEDFPYWGNTYGNGYKQSLEWLKHHAEQNAQLALIQGTAQNIPQIMLRSDIELNNNAWSGINREGEYLTELNFQGIRVAYPYAWDYVEKFLEPVYESKVDGVPVVRLWKNDLAHTKKEYQKEEKLFEGKISVERDNQIIIYHFPERLLLTRMTIPHLDEDCLKSPTEIYTSINGKDWLKEAERLPVEQISGKTKQDPKTLLYLFAGKQATDVKLIAASDESCFLQSQTKFSYLP